MAPRTGCPRVPTVLARCLTAATGLPPYAYCNHAGGVAPSRGSDHAFGDLPARQLGCNMNRHRRRAAVRPSGRLLLTVSQVFTGHPRLWRSYQAFRRVRGLPGLPCGMAFLAEFTLESICSKASLAPSFFPWR
jgi:hypothetical protein